MKNLKNLNCFIVNFEDLGLGRKYANLVFNPIFHSGKKSKNEYFGSKYACVRDEFRIWQRKTTNNHLSNVLITFGGTDPTNKTTEVLNILAKTNLKKIQFNVILGLGYKHHEKIKKLAHEMNKKDFKIQIVEKSDFLAKLMLDSDFAISSNGRTIFELASLNIPIISISVNRREKQHSFVEQSKTGFNLKFQSKINEKTLLHHIKRMMHYKTRKKFNDNLEKMDLLNGVDRVVQIINNGYYKKKF